MFKIKDDVERATVYIYGTIGDDWNEEDANRAKAFSQTLDQLSPKPLDLRIDSPGGDVYEGFAIASAIQRYEGETHAYVDGMAASAASYIALMADKVTMNDYAMFMIHNAWGLCVGNRDEMREMADRLEKIDGTIAGVIAARSSMELDEVKDAMSAETWYRGDEALEAGMCDEVIETRQRVAASLDRRIADRFRNIPEGVDIVDGQEAADEQAQRCMVTLNNNGLTFYPVSGDGSTEPVLEPAQDDSEDGTSHSPSTMCGNEGTGAKGAVLLGNKIYYRKEI